MGKVKWWLGLTVILGLSMLLGCGGNSQDNNNSGDNQGGEGGKLSPVQLEQGVYERINSYRLSKGLPTLKWDGIVAREARKHSQNLADGAVKWETPHAGFEDRIKAIGNVIAARENVAYEFNCRDPLTIVIDGWLNSPGHLANIQWKDGNYTGVGVAVSPDGRSFYTQIFIKR